MAGFGYGGAGSFMDGWNKEEERVSNSRADKRRKLQEMMDLAAQQGRPITSLDEMLSMSSEVGADMTHSMLEQMRETHNAKAKEAESKRRYETATRDDELSERIKKKALDMYASGKTPLAISEGLRQVYPENAVKIVMEQWDGVASSYEAQEYAKGIQHASTIDTEDEAKEHAKRMGLTEKATEGLMSAVRSKFKNSELKAMEWAASQGARLDRNDPAGFKAGVAEIVSNLPAALQPHAKTVESFLKSGGMQGQVAVQRQHENFYAQAGANAGGQISVNSAAADASEPIRIAKAAQDAAEAAQRSVRANEQAYAAALQKAASDPKSKLPQEARTAYNEVAALLASTGIDQRDADELLRLGSSDSSVDQGKYRERLASIKKLAPPIEFLRNQAATVASVAAGQVPAELGQAVRLLAPAMVHPPALSAAGVMYAEAVRNGRSVHPRGLMDSAAADMAESLVRMRQTIATSGGVSASQPEAEGVDHAVVSEWVRHFAASAGLDNNGVREMVSSVLSRASMIDGGARGFSRRASPGAIMRSSYRNGSPLSPYHMPSGGPIQGDELLDPAVRAQMNEFGAANFAPSAGAVAQAEQGLRDWAATRPGGARAAAPQAPQPAPRQPQIADADIARIMAAMNGGTDFAPRPQAPPPAPAPRRQINWADLDAQATGIGPMLSRNVPAPAPRPEMVLVQTPNGPRLVEKRLVQGSR